MIFSYANLPSYIKTEASVAIPATLDRLKFIPVNKYAYQNYAIRNRSPNLDR